MTGRGYALRLAGALAFVALAVWGAWSSYGYYDRRFYRGRLPQQIGVSDTLIIDGRLLSGCGVASFWLDQPTLAAVKREGLEFFKDAVRSRGSQGSSNGPWFASWQPTPMPAAWFSDGWWRGFDCADALTHDWKVKIYEAARTEGSFYSRDRADADWLVIPDLKIVVLIYER